MNDLRELYQEVILDHSRRPRNFREMAEANRQAEGYNPLCGDRATVYLHVEDDVVQDVSFKGVGCSISTASASMMTEALRGRLRVPDAGEVRVAPLAHDEGRPRGRAKGNHGVTRW
jgi:nitrogen fixation NifU-like protein